ncbi:MAG TPA: hypothetical protein VMB52_06480 [Verrucomicrobiae bacterium]|nr:hypothetical protein [Verrucomicrobiae bacterium]
MARQHPQTTQPAPAQLDMMTALRHAAAERVLQELPDDGTADTAYTREYIQARFIQPAAEPGVTTKSKSASAKPEKRRGRRGLRAAAAAAAVAVTAAISTPLVIRDEHNSQVAAAASQTQVKGVVRPEMVKWGTMLTHDPNAHKFPAVDGVVELSDNNFQDSGNAVSVYMGERSGKPNPKDPQLVYVTEPTGAGRRTVYSLSSQEGSAYAKGHNLASGTAWSATEQGEFNFSKDQNSYSWADGSSVTTDEAQSTDDGHLNGAPDTAANRATVVKDDIENYVLGNYDTES